MRGEIVTFGIPLIAKDAAHDWDAVLHHLNATLGSIYNQTDPHFRVVIACSDRPDIAIRTDERLHFIHCDPGRQINQLSFVSDQSLKNHAVGRYLRELGGGYLFGTDADDLISNRVVEFIRSDRNPNGYVVDRGYMFDAARGILACFPFEDAGHWRFDHECGTCTAVHFRPEDLPDSNGGTPARFAAYMARGHPGRRPAAAREGRPLAEFPFRAVTYVKNTGENLSERRSKALELERLAFQARLEDGIISNKVERTAELDTEFNLQAAQGFSRKSTSGVDLVGLGFSIGIVTYRRPERLRRLLASLKPQTEGRRDREIIIINDGSHDAAYQTVVDEFAAMIRYVPLATNVGIAAARNRCVAEAAGEYIVFTDDDCVAPPWWLDWLASRLAKSPEVDVVAGTTEPLWRTRGFFERVQAHYRLLPHPWMSPDRPVFVTACVAIRRAMFKRVGGFGLSAHLCGGGHRVCDADWAAGRPHRPGSALARDA